MAFLFIITIYITGAQGGGLDPDWRMVRDDNVQSKPYTVHGYARQVRVNGPSSLQDYFNSLQCYVYRKARINKW